MKEEYSTIIKNIKFTFSIKPTIRILNRIRNYFIKLLAGKNISVVLNTDIDSSNGIILNKKYHILNNINVTGDFKHILYYQPNRSAEISNMSFNNNKKEM
jgi:hypothetical protein